MPPSSNSDVDQYSTTIGLIYIYNLIVGTGALALPAVFSRAGWALGIIIISTLALFSYVTVTFVIESMASVNAIITWQRIKQRESTNASTERESTSSDSEETPLVLQSSDNFEQNENSTNYYSIHVKRELGDMASILFNKTGITLFYTCLVLYLYGDLSIYAVAIGKSMADVACTYQSPNFTCNQTIPITELCWEGTQITRFDAYRIFLTTFILMVGPFAFFNIQKTKYLQLFTSAMRGLAFSIMIIYALRILVVSGPHGSPPAANVYGLPGLFGVCVYSFMCHHSLPALIAPIANKKYLNDYLLIDYMLIIIFYLLLALTGTFAFAHLDDLYTLDFGPRGCSGNGNIFLIIIEYFLALFPVFTLSTSFPIIAITLRNNLKTLIINDDNRISNTVCFRKLFFPFLAIIPPYIIAMLTEDITVLVEITGSFAGVGIQYLIPIFLVSCARKQTSDIISDRVKNHFSSPFTSKCWIFFVFAWAITCMILVSINLIETLH